MKKTAEKMKKNHERVLLTLYDLTSGSRFGGISVEDLAAETELSEAEVRECHNHLNGLVHLQSKRYVLEPDGLECARILDERRFRVEETRRNRWWTLGATFAGVLIGSFVTILAQWFLNR